jgi:hypothetical protein
MGKEKIQREMIVSVDKNFFKGQSHPLSFSYFIRLHRENIKSTRPE